MVVTVCSGHLYHLVSIGWISLLCVFIGVYVGVVGVFALLFAACNGMNRESPGNARNFFNLSLQTLASTGYGALYPASTCSRWISMIESLVSMLLISFMTGVAFVKFARPHPNILLSNVFTVSQGEKGLEMRFRVANETPRASNGDIIDIGFKLILMRIETGRQEEKRLCFYDLKLEKARLISLRLEVELIHAIAGNSPFLNKTLDDLARSDFVLILLASGMDENLHDMVYKKQEYGQETMRWGARFLPALDWDSHHKFIKFDLGKISAVTPAPFNSYDEHSISEKEEHDLLTSCNDVGNVNIEHARQHSSHCFQADHARPPRVADDSPCELVNEFDDSLAMRKANEDCQRDEEKSDVNSSTNGMAQVGGCAMQRDSFSFDVHEWDEKLGEHSMDFLQRNIRVKNRSHSFLLNGVHQRALETSWPSLLLSLVMAYLLVVALLALLISISIHDPLEQPVDSSFANKFEEVFFFCVQTISTVAYGALSPRQDSDGANLFVFVLVFSGVFVSTLVTGITWAKFSIPKASALLYSDVLLLNAFHLHRAVMFRAANNRKFGVIVEGSFRMSVVVLNRNLGRRETHELRLIRNVWPIINLCNVLIHIIDESSPLYHLSTNDLLSGDHFFVVLFTGHDDIISDTMVARKAYHACDIRMDHYFKDNIRLSADGLYIDLDAINATYCSQSGEVENHESRPSCSFTEYKAAEYILEASQANSPHSSYELL